MSDDELIAMEVDAKRVSELRANSHWMNTPPPWKAVGEPVGEPDKPGCYGKHWSITSDAGDPRDEYDVFSSPDEGLAKWVAEMPVLMPALAAHVLSLTEEVRRLREREGEWLTSAHLLNDTILDPEDLADVGKLWVNEWYRALGGLPVVVKKSEEQ